MKQFKHKATNKIASLGIFYYQIENEPSQIPEWVLTTSSDWVKVPEYMRLNNSEGLWDNTVKMNGGKLIFDVNFITYTGRSILKESIDQPRFFTPATKEEYDNQLCVPIGTKFTVGGDKAIFTIGLHADPERVSVTWPGGITSYYKRTVNHCFSPDGNWKVYVEKPVLFTTTNGVDIKEGDSFFVVDEFFEFSTHCEENEREFTASPKTPLPIRNEYYFSTEEAAQDFIDKNKLVYTKNDVLTALGKLDYAMSGVTEDLAYYEQFL